MALCSASGESLYFFLFRFSCTLPSFSSPSPVAMGCSPSKQEVILRIGDRDFPRHLLNSLCSDAPMQISKLVLSMRAAGFIGSLLQHAPAGVLPQDVRPTRSASGDSSHTVFMSDGNTYELDSDTVISVAGLPAVLAGVHELMVR